MAVPRTYYCRHSDLRSFAGVTWSAAAGTPDADFPLANLLDPRPDRVTKLEETSGTIRATLDVAAALQAIVLVNVSATSPVTITNNNSMGEQQLVVPASPVDGLCRNAWLDLREVTTSATQWDLAFPAHGSPIAVGGILLVEVLRDITVSWDTAIAERLPAVVHRTAYGVALGYARRVRMRVLTPRLDLEQDRSAYADLRRASRGPHEPFPVVIEHAATGPVYVWCPEEDWQATLRIPGMTQWADRLEEVNAGLAL